MPEQDECRGTEVGETRSRAGSDQVPSLEFHKFVISEGFLLKSILALLDRFLGFLFPSVRAHFEENISTPVQANSNCCLVLDFIKLFHRVMELKRVVRRSLQQARS